MDETTGPLRRQIVAVIGSGGEISAADAARPAAVGRWLAQRGLHLLTGGGAGVMEAAGEGFCSVPHAGVSIGVLPAGRDPAKYPNRYVEVAIRTHLAGPDPKGPGSRNHINVLSADAVVAFPGRQGTRAELELAREHFAAAAKDRIVVVLAAGQDIGGLRRAQIAQLGIPLAETSGEAIAFLSEKLGS